MKYTIKATISFESEIEVEADSADEAKDSLVDVPLTTWVGWSDGHHHVERSEIEEK